MNKKEMIIYIENEKNIKISHIQKDYQIKKNVLENSFDIIKEKAQEIVDVAESLNGKESLTQIMKDILYNFALILPQFDDLDSIAIIEIAANNVAATYFGIII